MDIVDDEKGILVKTGDKFGIIGWWVNKDMADPLNPKEVGDPDDGVPRGGNKRAIYVYFGKNKPSEDEMKELINNTQFYIDDGDY